MNTNLGQKCASSLNKLSHFLIVPILACLILTPGSVFGQIKAEGPIYVEPGELCRIQIDGLDALNDPKIKCFPENQSWEAIRRLDGSPTVLFYTKKEGSYTFVIAGNKDNKTVLTVHQVIVGRGPIPPPGLVWEPVLVPVEE